MTIVVLTGTKSINIILSSVSCSSVFPLSCPCQGIMAEYSNDHSPNINFEIALPVPRSWNSLEKGSRGLHVMPGAVELLQRK